MPKRIEPKEARRMLGKSDALLVCAYDDADKYEENALEGSVPLSHLEEREEIDKERSLVFYCA